jgi:ABC-type dipeptide/oligopeptide/nickel transport system ATPase component
MAFDFTIPTTEEPTEVSVESGSSVVFVGANGGGKTRLAVHIEDSLKLNAHRISAHRALTLNPSVAKIGEQMALSGLRTGYAAVNAHAQHRIGHRWTSNAAVSLLNDFDFLVQALFADQANKALETHTRVRAHDFSPAEPTKLERLKEIWERMLPHRHLHISGDDIKIANPDFNTQYQASEMSDGERAIFYLIGQTLVAANDSLLIVDEPELHVHQSIMAKLWDELEAARQDCAFVFITHDLWFAASRTAQKFVIRGYDPSPRWSIELVPEDTGFGEELTTLILGSRQPILFVEGIDVSLDQAIYRCCFPNWTVTPRGSCEEVIHSVVTMRRNEVLTRVTCSGVVDADDYQAEEIAHLDRLGVAVLPVSEIENIILLPPVSRAIAMSDGYEGADLENRLSALKVAIFETLDSAALIDQVVMRYCRRRIDRLLKKIDLSEASTVDEITDLYVQATTALNVEDIAREAAERIQRAIQDQDLPSLLANYDNKGLMALAARHLKNQKLADFKSWLIRVLRNNKVPALDAAIRDSLPLIQPR